MTKNKLKQIRRDIRSLRQRAGNIHDRELVTIAKSLGRSLSDRGKHPTYVSTWFPDLRPISIPSHSGAIKRYTAENILDSLEEDCCRWEEQLNKEARKVR